MQRALANKPEITPPIVVNSRTGVTINQRNCQAAGQVNPANTEAVNQANQPNSLAAKEVNDMPIPCTSSSTTNSLDTNRKRKLADKAAKESPATKRHRECMEFRQMAHTQFLELMGKLIEKL
jgi:hypothetical protein